MATNPVIDDLRRIKRGLTLLNGQEIKIGICDNVSGEVLMIANVHEYGCTIKVTPRMKAFLRYKGINLKSTTAYINIPERSFIRESFDTGQREMNEIVKAEYVKVINGETTPEKAMESIGMQLVQLTQNYVREGKVTPEISDYTKEHRASTTETPLFDTGDNIVSRISYKIVTEGGG